PRAWASTTHRPRPENVRDVTSARPAGERGVQTCDPAPGVTSAGCGQRRPRPQAGPDKSGGHPMSEFTISYPGGKLDLPERKASDGPSGLEVNNLLKETGNVTLDAGFVNTASCTSAITYIDGDQGILRYRGYPIEQLAEHSTFLETSYLLIHGELPTAA